MLRSLRVIDCTRRFWIPFGSTSFLRLHFARRLVTGFSGERRPVLSRASISRKSRYRGETSPTNLSLHLGPVSLLHAKSLSRAIVLEIEARPVKRFSPSIRSVDDTDSLSGGRSRRGLDRARRLNRRDARRRDASRRTRPSLRPQPQRGREASSRRGRYTSTATPGIIAGLLKKVGNG